MEKLEETVQEATAVAPSEDQEHHALMLRRFGQYHVAASARLVSVTESGRLYAIRQQQREESARLATNQQLAASDYRALDASRP